MSVNPYNSKLILLKNNKICVFTSNFLIDLAFTDLSSKKYF